MKKNKRALSLKTKITLSFILVSLIASSILGVSLYTRLNSEKISQITRSLLNAASAASILVDGDLHKSLKPGDESSEGFVSQRNKLEEFQKAAGVKYLYTLKLEGDKAFFVFDTDSEAETAIGEEYVIEDNMKDALIDMQNAWAGKPSVTGKPYSDEFGTFISAYAPVHDSAGNVVALVGADYDISYIAGEILNTLIETCIFALLALLVTIVIALYISNKIYKPIKTLHMQVRELADFNGDLTGRISIKTSDTIEFLGDETNRLVENIANLIRDLRKLSSELNGYAENTMSSISNLAASSTEVSSAMDTISQGVGAQSESINSTLSTFENLSSRLDSIIMEIEKLFGIINGIKDSSAEENRAFSSLLSSSEENNKISSSIQNSINELSGRAENIEKIIETVNSISNQTNLLALNAAIEAARAGEHGMGFGVVADEIRKLAEQSEGATKEISHIIGEVKDNINLMAGLIQSNTSAVKNQSDTVKSTHKLFDNILSLSSRAHDSVSSLSGHIAAIKNGKNAMLESMESISSISVETAASTEEVCASAEQQSEEAMNIEGIVSSLKESSENLKRKISNFKIE